MRIGHCHCGTKTAAPGQGTIQIYWGCIHPIGQTDRLIPINYKKSCTFYILIYLPKAKKQKLREISGRTIEVAIKTTRWQESWVSIVSGIGNTSDRYLDFSNSLSGRTGCLRILQSSQYRIQENLTTPIAPKYMQALLGNTFA